MSFRISAVILILILLPGCSREYFASIDFVQGRPTIVIKKAYFPFRSREQRLCVESVWLHSSDGTTVWRLRAAPQECVWFSRIAIGQKPRGMVEEIKLVPLKVGADYFAAIGTPKFGFASANWTFEPHTNERLR